jgi:UDP-glucose 4-epimerase
MKYLVTGGCGFIGSHIVDSLVAAGHGVVIIDNESSDSHEYFNYNDKARYHKLDICDYDSIKHLFENVDTVFHLAAESRIQPSIENPMKAISTNVYGTCSVLQAAREFGVRRVVYSSTSSAYGLSVSSPNKETDLEDCLNPYSVSKVSGEKLCKMYSDLYGLETIVLRYFNVYGERQPTKGQYSPVTGVFLRQFKQGEPLTIVGDGTQRRDFIHVSDVVGANILASSVSLSSSETVKYGDVFNIGLGENYSVKEIADMISENQIFIDQRKGEAKETLADIHRAKQYLGWKPKVKLKFWIESELI